MFENLELTCDSISFHNEFIVAPSGWKLPDASSVCRESMQILQKCETCSRSAQAPLTLKVNPLLISKCNFIQISVEKKFPYIPSDSMSKTRGLTPGFDSLLCHFGLFHSTAYPRWWDAFVYRQTDSLPKIRCSRNGSLDNDDTEKLAIIDPSLTKPAHMTPIPHTDISVFLVSSWPQISTNLLRTT